MTTPAQLEGCLPAGYTLDSLLTREQFQKWRRVGKDWLAARIDTLPGVVISSRNDAVIHPRTFLEVVAKRKRP